jgi:diaminopimelate epimerase
MGIPTVGRKTVRLKDGARIEGAEISTGNPHFVIAVQGSDFAVAGKPWQVAGEEICFHSDFPNQTNVEFVRKVTRDEIEIRIFERGVGATTSSGTGSSASATAAIALLGCASPLTVAAPGGAQMVEWNGTGTELYLTGPAALVARGEAWES